MKIAQVNDTIYPYFKGGAPKRVWEISRRLAGKGHTVHIFGMKYWDGDDFIISEGVHLHGVCPGQELYINGRRSIRQALYFAYRLLPPLLREKFDVIDCSNFPYFPCFPAWLHSLTRGSTLVITWLEVWGNYWYQYLGNAGLAGVLVEKLVARLGRDKIAISEVTRRGILSLGVTEGITVIIGGIDLDEIKATAPSGDSSDVIYAGRLITDKNIDRLIRAIALLKPARPGLRCLIIGDGPERDRLERLARELGLAGQVSFSGFLESSGEVLARLKASRVFVLPSTREGFGLALAEANACGIPAVTVRHPLNAAAELIVDGKNGFIAETDETDLARKIGLALDRGAEMQADCLAYSARYDWARVVDKIEATYQNALAKEGKRP
ncbi:MAG: glycosyltransferase family 4 protein [Chloroflexota bacterium]